MRAEPSTGGRRVWRLVAGLASALLIALLGTTEAGAQPTALPTTPEEYERVALENHPGLQALHAEWQAMRAEGRAAASAFPEPMAGYTLGLGTESNNAGVRRHMFMLSQTIPWPGVLAERDDPAQARARAVAHRYEATAFELEYAVRSALLEVARVDSIAALLVEQRDTVLEVATHQERTMAYSTTSYTDVLRLHLTAERLDDQLDQLASARAEQVAQLRGLTGLPNEALLTFDWTDADGLLEDSASLPNTAELIAAARLRQPLIAALEVEATAEEEFAEVARDRRLPWPTVSLTYELMVQSDGAAMGMEGDQLLLGVAFPLPIIGAPYDAEADASLSRASARRSERTVVVLELGARVEASVARLGVLDRRRARYDTELLPMAADVTSTLLFDLEHGRADHTDYFLAVEQEIELRTERLDLSFAIAQERARLNLLTSGLLDEPLGRPSAVQIVSERTFGDHHE